MGRNSVLFVSFILFYLSYSLMTAISLGLFSLFEHDDFKGVFIVYLVISIVYSSPYLLVVWIILILIIYLFKDRKKLKYFLCLAVIISIGLIMFTPNFNFRGLCYVIGILISTLFLILYTDYFIKSGVLDD